MVTHTVTFLEDVMLELTRRKRCGSPSTVSGGVKDVDDDINVRIGTAYVCYLRSDGVIESVRYQANDTWSMRLEYRLNRFSGGPELNDYLTTPESGRWSPSIGVANKPKGHDGYPKAILNVNETNTRLSGVHAYTGWEGHPICGRPHGKCIVGGDLHYGLDGKLNSVGSVDMCDPYTVKRLSLRRSLA